MSKQRQKQRKKNSNKTLPPPQINPALRRCKVATHVSGLADQFCLFDQAIIVDIIKDTEFWQNGTIWLLINSPLLEPVVRGAPIPELRIIMNFEEQKIRFVTLEQWDKELEESKVALAKLAKSQAEKKDGK